MNHPLVLEKHRSLDYSSADNEMLATTTFSSQKSASYVSKSNILPAINTESFERYVALSSKKKHCSILSFKLKMVKLPYFFQFFCNYNHCFELVTVGIFHVPKCHLSQKSHQNRFKTLMKHLVRMLLLFPTQNGR